MDNTVISISVIDGIPVELRGTQMEDEEIRLYISRGQKIHGRIEGLTIIADGDYVELLYKLPTAKFDRIRRITGYLVGTLDRFNNGKRAEVMDRVKHSCC
ncbi:MAG: anaerobic ribonucleoside-triphosphate reductase [Huintestinicola sp.]